MLTYSHEIFAYFHKESNIYLETWITWDSHFFLIILSLLQKLPQKINISQL